MMRINACFLATYHGMYSSSVAGFNQKFYICVHEWHSHRYCGAIWQYEAGIMTKLLYYAEDVIPSTAIKTSTMIAKFINNLP